ncbi:DUF11 domain-containing protein [Sulfidibacter corallicola]|uniref:DUF11 domain-containing protein n=1 Tax=Sulfidibacter corallicola TaxID=2818388 RepID=A0A8A4TUW4_SULCO|nr:hypothetical protein [Sulfidibacter corallicola]QTD50315.1 DUF11 domain-containing protein [Sulfidibacter corallicola]
MKANTASRAVQALTLLCLVPCAALGQSADLAVFQNIDPPQPVLDGQATYTITVENLGPDPADNVTLTVTLPPGTVLQSHEPTGNYDEPSHTLSWDLGTVTFQEQRMVEAVLDLPLTAPETQFDVFLTGAAPAMDSSALLRAGAEAEEIVVVATLDAEVNPSGLTFTPEGVMIYTDMADPNLMNGEDPIIDGRIVVNTPGTPTVLSSAGLLVNPRAIVPWPNGYLVADPDGFPAGLARGPTSMGRLLAIDGTTGQQTVFSENGHLLHPLDLALDAEGSVVVIDSNTNLVRVDKDSAQQTLLTSGNLLVEPVAVAADSTGDIWVADSTSGIVRVDGGDFGQSVLTPIGGTPTFENPFDLIMTRNQHLIVNTHATTPERALFDIDPQTGMVANTIEGTDTFFYRGLAPQYSVTSTATVESATSDPNNANDLLALNTVVLPPTTITTTINVSEQIGVADQVTVTLAPQLMVVESVSVADTVTVSPAPQITVNEAVTVGDTVQVSPAPQITVNESISVADGTSTTPALQLAVSEQVQVADGGVFQPMSGAPRVDLVFAPGQTDLFFAEGVATSITQLRIKFNEAMADPPGDEEDQDVTNPQHYRLIGSGSDGEFQTEVCGTQLGGDDQLIDILRVTYAEFGETATLHLDPTMALPAGSYRILVCGDLGLVDLESLALDGDGNSSPGGDFRGDFKTLADNLLNNPHFDETLNGWTIDGGTSGTIQRDDTDADGSATSGSAAMQAGEPEETLQLSQCLPLEATSWLQVGGRVQVRGASGAANLEVSLQWFAEAGCSGAPIDEHVKPQTLGDTESRWVAFGFTAAVPENAVAALLTLRWQTAENTPDTVVWDQLFVNRDTHLLFEDGFESGDTNIWQPPD